MAIEGPEAARAGDDLLGRRPKKRSAAPAMLAVPSIAALAVMRFGPSRSAA
jgi:hypothetical protein